MRLLETIAVLLFIALIIFTGIVAEEASFNSDACYINGYEYSQWVDHGKFFNTRDQAIMCYNLDGSTLLLDFGEEK